LQKVPPGGKRLELKLRPAPGDSVFQQLASLELLDSAAWGGIRFTPPARWAGWAFRLDEGETSYPVRESSGNAEAAGLPVGRYRLFAFRDDDRDGVWNPGALKPWIPQEPHVLALDSVEVTPGPARDITGLLERARK
jgi:hypothetical protein